LGGITDEQIRTAACKPRWLAPHSDSFPDRTHRLRIETVEDSLFVVGDPYMSSRVRNADGGAAYTHPRNRIRSGLDPEKLAIAARCHPDITTPDREPARVFGSQKERRTLRQEGARIEPEERSRLHLHAP
jgi:hypothetical protein